MLMLALTFAVANAGETVQNSQEYGIQLVSLRFLFYYNIFCPVFA